MAWIVPEKLDARETRADRRDGNDPFIRSVMELLRPARTQIVRKKV